MKRVISLLLCLAMLCTMPIIAAAHKGENYVLYSTESVVFPTNQHVKGDSNGDGKVNVLDVIATLRYISGNKKGTLGDSIDTNSDGSVNIADVLLIVRHVLGENTDLGKLVG